MKKNLSNIEKKILRKKGYSLKPVVMVGKNGLTEAVPAEIDVSLTSHELIKIRIRGGNKNERYNLCLKIQHKLKIELVPQIGFIKVFIELKQESNLYL